ncbi:MAG: hypothetical protein C0405_09835 [Desulfovibrio sp.]|nr:hypothetical protein [Desulfovibrio sp.]
MEILPQAHESTWTLPSWLHPRLIADARFARAYETLGDQRRALLKGLMADHYSLAPPLASLASECSRQLASGLTLRTLARPRPFVLLLIDPSLDAPALFLAALMPALCSGAAHVLVVRLGPRSQLPDVLLTACELAGQERVAALGPTLAVSLLSECALSGLPGLVLYPETLGLRRVLQRPALRAQLEASRLRLVPLRPPRALGLWRDAPDQFAPERVDFLYAGLSFEAGGAGPGRQARKAKGPDPFAAFAATPRDLLLAPDARLGPGRTAARLLVGESRTGLWAWPGLTPEVFAETSQAFSSAPAPLS